MDALHFSKILFNQRVINTQYIIKIEVTIALIRLSCYIDVIKIDIPLKSFVTHLKT